MIYTDSILSLSELSVSDELSLLIWAGPARSDALQYAIYQIVIVLLIGL